MGAVYRARSLSTGRDVALKTLLAGRDATPQQRTRFAREAQALAKVDHPHVVRLVEVGEHQGVPFLAMEFQPGGSLDELIRRSRLPVADVVLLGVQLASALEAAHAEGILHRDLKPGNVLIASDGRAMLTDFGLAKDLHREGQTQRLTQSGIFLGSPGYWAPEQAAAQAERVCPATDVYGLGAILYAALTGRAPIVASGLIENLHLTANERPPTLRSLRAEVPAKLEAILLRCLEKEVGARWASAAELKAAFQTLQEAESLPASSRQGWVVAALGLSLAGVSALGLSLLQPESPRATPQPTALAAKTPTPAASEAEPSADALYKEATALLGAKRYLESIPLLRRAAEQGHVKAAFKLGFVLAKGRGAPPDLERGLVWYQRAAAGGHPFAQYELGMLLARGEGLARDDARARALFRQAAEQGNRAAMTSLGEFLESGRGGEEDLAGALDWYRKAAELGQDRAMFLLALILGEGKRVPRDDEQAALWYRRSAEAGYAPGMFKFAWCLEKGLGVKPDKALAIQWYRRAAERGMPEAMSNYASFLEFGDGVPRDVEGAVEWYRKAAETKNLTGLLGLGRCYQKGRGVPQDFARALALYQEAATLGSPQAMVALGLSLSAGRGVPVDKPEAARWFRKAADLGDANGAYSLAKMLLEADGVPADELAARKLLQLGIAQDHPESLHTEACLLMQRNQGQPEAEAEARRLFRRAAEQGFLDAMFNLAVALASGTGGPMDPVEARKWFQVVAAKSSGNPRLKDAALRALRRLERN